MFNSNNRIGNDSFALEESKASLDSFSWRLLPSALYLCDDEEFQLID